MGVVLDGNTRKEKELKRRIASLKKREKEIRDERHRLESELRVLVFKRYTEMGEKISLKLEKKR